MSTRHAAALAALTALTALATSGCDGQNLNLSIDRARVQERITQKFPIQRELSVATVNLSEPVVDFKAGPDRIGLTTQVKVQRGKIPLAITGQARASGKVRYEPADATFYMTDIRVEQMELPLKLGNEKSREVLRDALNAAIAGSLKDIPLDTLQSASGAEAAGALIKDVRVQDDKLTITLGLGGSGGS